ncbi:DUF1015 domain-containing protein [Eisenbergiella porci]|uniref:DUF1015 domain-containing protein n=1 Tax=Eisenbergiella porci TaxID=2652274 RepID=UPI002A7EE06B|nr:DUF1015 family protein [Eisenbergiella porci]
MAEIRPFCAYRPKKGLEGRIAALPYDVYNRAEAKAEVQKEPLSFLSVDRAETQFDDSVDVYADCVYEKARELLWKRIEEGYFVQEESPVYYIYELIMDGRSQTGITACASVDDYLGQVIKKHENTRADKEADRIRHVEACDAQTGPIFLAYRSRPVINEIVAAYKKEEPLYDFTAEDGITHRVWRIGRPQDVDAIHAAFSEINEIYIADGHHRCASAVKVSQMRRQAKPGYTGEEPFNFFLSVLFPDDQLMIMDYNRVVKDLNGYTEEEFLGKIGESFDIEECGEGVSHRPEAKAVFGMCLDGKWYRLKARPEICPTDPVKGLDVSILQDSLLGPVLGIKDPKTDKRIDFVGGIRGMKELERRVNEDCRVAFAMYPTSISELFAVADAGELMPPKSTWFEPKLRSGLFIHSLREK